MFLANTFPQENTISSVSRKELRFFFSLWHVYIPRATLKSSLVRQFPPDGSPKNGNKSLALLEENEARNQKILSWENNETESFSNRQLLSLGHHISRARGELIQTQIKRREGFLGRYLRGSQHLAAKTLKVKSSRASQSLV